MAIANLITDSYALQALAIYPLSTAQLAFMPNAIAAASAAIRRWCFDRDFNRGTYTELFPIALDGLVRLSQIPVNQVLRVQSGPVDALTIVNSSESVQMPRVYFKLVGDSFDGQTITGLTLTWSASGAAATQDVLFTADETIADLTTAINLVGSGWTATADMTLSSWPVTQLYGGVIAQGSTATFRVFATDLDRVRFHPDSGQLTGMLYCGGSDQSGGIGTRWGPGWDDGWQGGGQTLSALGQVLITYDAGFDVVPYPIQEVCVELTRSILIRLGIDPYLDSEHAGEYSYTLAKKLIYFLPAEIISGAAQYRVHNA